MTSELKNDDSGAIQTQETDLDNMTNVSNSPGDSKRGYNDESYKSTENNKINNIIHKSDDKNISNNGLSSLSSPLKKIMKNEVESPRNNSSTPTTIVLDREARTLNLALESSLLMTLRQDYHEDKTIIYMGNEHKVGDLLNTGNISELVCSRLSGRGEILNAVNYLSGCYKRIISKEVSASPKLRDDLVK